jgi:hypothetical protein
MPARGRRPPRDLCLGRDYLTDEVRRPVVWIANRLEGAKAIDEALGDAIATLGSDDGAAFLRVRDELRLAIRRKADSDPGPTDSGPVR